MFDFIALCLFNHVLILLQTTCHLEEPTLNLGLNESKVVVYVQVVVAAD